MNYYFQTQKQQNSQIMIKKPKVVNIAFQNRIIKKINTQGEESQKVDEQEAQIKTQKFMNNKDSIKSTLQLLNIIKGSPLSWNDLLKHIPENIVREIQIHSCSSNDDESLETIFPQNQQNKEQQISNQSIDAVISRTNTVYVDKEDKYEEQNENNCKKDKKHPSRFQEQKNIFSIHKNKINGKTFEQNQTFYLLPGKYQQNLEFILISFLNFKFYSSGKENSPGFLVGSKRPKTSQKKTQNMKAQSQFMSPQKKPTTALSHGRTVNIKTVPNQTSPFCKDDFNQYFQRIMLMEKEIQKKSKRIIQLQNQLRECSKTIENKNVQIRQLKQNQSILKKKLKSEIDKVMKGKVMTDINEIFLSNLSEQNNFGKNIFQINGKKYIKTQQAGSFTASTFVTSPKMSIFSRLNQKILETNKLSQSQTLKKSQSSTTLMRKSKASNKRLQIVRLNKLIETLEKQVRTFQCEKSLMYEKLAQNNSQIEKCIEKLQAEIQKKRLQITKVTEDLQRLKDS